MYLYTVNEMLKCIVFILFIKSSIQLQPNVLLIIVDDLRPALGIFGDPNAYTPNIDKLAKRSFIFTNAFAQQALCAPSRNSFLTSRRPDSLHLYDFYSYWRDTVGNFTTIPQHFKENGYVTHSIGKVFHPGISSNFTDDEKYSWTQNPYHPSTEKYKDAKVCINPEGKLAKNLICPVIVEEQPEGTLPDYQSLYAASIFFKKRNTVKDKQPYFLAVGFHKPHIPFKFPIEYLKYHPLEKIKVPPNHIRPSLLPNVAWNPWTDIRNREDIKLLNVSFPFGPLPEGMLKTIIQSYNAATTYTDDLIGELINYVDNRTIIAIIGDHGWSMGEHGEFSKFSNFDVAVKVPMIFYVPGLNKNQNGPITVENLVELVDLFPTFVDLTGISSSLRKCTGVADNDILCTEGKSLVPLMYLKAKKNPEEVHFKTAVFNQYPRPGVFPTEKPNSDKPRLNQIRIMGYSIRTTSFRYTEWVEFNHSSCLPNWSKTYGSEFYDHRIDPNENINLVSRSELKTIVMHLRKMLIEGWRYI